MLTALGGRIHEIVVVRIRFRASHCESRAEFAHKTSRNCFQVIFNFAT